MSTYNTGNPVGSVDVKDLYDNAQGLDHLVNDRTVTEYPDRLGNPRKSWWGMEQDFNAFLLNSQFEYPPLNYVDGTPLTVLRATQLIQRAGQLYRVRLPATFPVNLTGTWATDAPLLTATSDAALRQDLANDFDPLLGASLVGFQGGTVDDFIGDCIVMKTGASAADLTAAIATGREVVIPNGVSVTINNSAGPGLTISQNSVRIRGKGSIIATSDANDLIRSTGSDFRIDGITLQGPGTYRPDLSGTGEPPSLLACRGEDALVSRCTFVNPYGAGCFVRGAAGAKVLFNRFTSAYSGSIAQPFLFHVYLRVASDTLVYGNTCVGSIQGICGGGDGSGTVTVTGKNGASGSNLRNTIIQGNTCAGQLDHSIYISNNSVQTTIDSNQVECANDLIKIEGGPNIVTNNRGVGGSGITGRNVFNTLIDGNILITTLSSVSAYGILLYEQVFKRPINDVTISNNTLTCTGAVSNGGIYVLGDVWDGYQSVLSNIKITGNTLTGYGNNSEGFGIQVRQALFPTNPVTGSFGTNVIVADNVINFPTHSVPTYGIQLAYGLKGGAVTGNVINGFRSIGVRFLGVQDFESSGNTLNVDPTAVSAYGFNERAKDLSLHYNSLNNRYGGNRFAGTFGRTVQHSDESCQNLDRIVLRRTGSLSSDTILAAQWPYLVVYNNHSAGAAITLENNANSPWPVDREVVVANAGASNSLTVNGNSVVAGSSIRLVCTGSNTFIKAN